MARAYAKNWFTMWTDEDFCDQPRVDKLLYQVLLGQPPTLLNNAGVQPLSFKRWRKSLRDGSDMPTETEVKEALVRMEIRGYVFTDDDTGELLIRSFIRNDQVDKQPTVLLSALRAAALLESPKLAGVLLTELTERMVLPEIGGTSGKAETLRRSLKQSFAAATTHLETLSRGSTQGSSLPFAEDLSEPSSQGLSRPAETRGSKQGSTQGSKQGTVGVEVEVVTSPPEVITLGESADSTAETGDTEPLESPNEPPSATNRPNDPEPPSRCPKHRGKPEHDGKCPPCGEFRKAHDRWEERDRRRRAQAVSDAAHAAAAVRQAAIDACELCDEDGYRGKLVCSHRAEESTAGARTAARELVHAALSAKQRTEPSDTQDDETWPADVPGSDNDE